MSKKPPRWKKFIPIRVRAMLLAGNRLVVAGPPDKIISSDPLATFEGKSGAELQLFSAGQGKLISSMKLESPPVFDGISAAGGRIYMATENGKLICME